MYNICIRIGCISYFTLKQMTIEQRTNQQEMLVYLSDVSRNYP